LDLRLSDAVPATVAVDPVVQALRTLGLTAAAPDPLAAVLLQLLRESRAREVFAKAEALDSRRWPSAGTMIKAIVPVTDPCGAKRRDSGGAAPQCGPSRQQIATPRWTCR
jgi:hypothetical protein